jgi:hypothetical protein
MIIIFINFFVKRFVLPAEKIEGYTHADKHNP